jgi:Uma2 family endonuclease
MGEIEMSELGVKPHLFTVEEYMASNVPGHTELISGVIYDVPQSSPPHAHAAVFLSQRLIRQLDADRYQVRGTQPLELAGCTGYEEPEPDIAVVRESKYLEHHPTAGDAFVAIEVTDSTYMYDRNVKIPLYTGAGIPALIVNIPARRVESYAPHETNADPHFYTEEETFDILGVPIRVSELLPKK